MINNIKNHEYRFILASASSTRADLLSKILPSFEMISANVDERSLERNVPDAQPYKLAKILAEAKAMDVAKRYPDRIIIGSDQVLELDGDILHKPPDEQAAIKQIMRLAGRTHKLHSAVAIARGGSLLKSFVRSAFMTIQELDHDTVRRYVRGSIDMGILSSVGGYHFEGAGIMLFSSVSGSHSTILGLPLQETSKCLQMICKD